MKSGIGFEDNIATMTIDRIYQNRQREAVGHFLIGSIDFTCTTKLSGGFRRRK